MTPLRPRPTYSGVAATLALAVALGTGGAYAAAKIDGRTIKAGTVRTAQLGKNAVTSPKVKNGSLRAVDFKAGQLPAGAPGPAGTRQGPRDPKGLPDQPVPWDPWVRPRRTATSATTSTRRTGRARDAQRLRPGRASTRSIATLALSNNDLTKPTTIDCRLFSGNQEASVGDADLPARGGSYPSYQDGTIAMTGVITLNADANINVGCRLSAASGVTFGDSYLVATKVGSVVNQ